MHSNKYLLKKNIDSSNEIEKYIDIGRCIKIINSEKSYQIIGFNPKMNICWVREWPLNFCRYQTFGLSLNKIIVASSCEINTK